MNKDLKDEAEHLLCGYNFPRADRQSITGQGQCFGATAWKDGAESLEPKQARLVQAAQLPPLSSKVSRLCQHGRQLGGAELAVQRQHANASNHRWPLPLLMLLGWILGLRL